MVHVNNDDWVGSADAWRRFIYMGEAVATAMVDAEDLLLGNEAAARAVVREAIQFMNGVAPDVQGDKPRRLAALHTSGAAPSATSIEAAMDANVVVRLVVLAAAFEGAWDAMREEVDRRVARWDAHGDRAQSEVWVLRQEALRADPYRITEVVDLLTDMAAAEAASPTDNERALGKRMQKLAGMLDGCAEWEIFEYMGL